MTKTQAPVSEQVDEGASKAPVSDGVEVRVLPGACSECERLKADLDRQKALNAELHKGVCSGYTMVHAQWMRMKAALTFALSEESGFACPTTTEERLRAALKGKEP